MFRLGTRAFLLIFWTLVFVFWTGVSKEVKIEEDAGEIILQFGR